MGKVTKSASCWLFVGIMMLFGFMSCLSPSGNDGKVGLDTVSLTYGVDVINVHAGTANETGISPMWSLADTMGITYSIAAAETGGPETDGVDSGVINIAPATGTITITAQAIVANSGAYVVTATADLTSPAYTEGSTATTTITVTVNDGKVDLGGVTLAYTSEGAITTDVGTADDTGISPIWSLASTEDITYSIAAAETDGPVTGGAGDTIIISQATGKITITAQAIVANSGAYTVTATAGNDSPAYTEGSTATKTITVTVNKANLNTNKLTYGVDVINVHAGTANDTGISPSWSLSSTTDITYSIAAAGASGPATDGVVANTINIASATGQITITAQAIVANSGAYVVTATAGSTSPAYTDGSTATTTITVTVNDGKVDLDDVALAYTRDGAITADVGTANTTGISPIWSLASMTGITYSIAAAGAEARGPTTDGVEGNTINIAPDTGTITITAQAIVANSGAYEVTATAGSDSPAYTDNSTATTTITVTVNKASLSDIALAYDSEGYIATDVGTANDAGISPSWLLADMTGISYSIAAAGAGAGGPTTDGVTANTISIGQNTGMITITAQAIVANSGAYVVTATADNDSPAYIDGSTATTTITVTVNKIALLPLAYDSTTITTDVGTANDTGISPSWKLADTTGITYSIAAAETGDSVPTTDGVGSNTINFNQATGKITITDRAIATNSGAYTVTATAESTSPIYTEGSTTTTTITVTVNKIALLPLAYDPATITTDVGTANDTGISPSWILADMTGITYSIAAAGAGGPRTNGVEGNTISIGQNTGQITITDRAIATNSGAYEVTATADSNSPVYTEGNTTTTTITVTVNKVALLPLAYDPATITTAVGTASTISPSWKLADTTGITYSIAAAETGDSVPTTNGVEGNTINIDSTGTITITDQAIIDNSGEYTVTATAEGTSPAYTDGSTATTTITVTVNKASLSDIALAYDSEGSITTDVGTANDTGIRPSWSLIDTAGITYSIAATETGDSVPTTDGAESNTINIDSTGMITITAQAIVANSGAYVVTATADITSPVYTEGSTATTTITVTVNKIALNTEELTYSENNIISTAVGTANDTGISPSWSLADMTGIIYSIAAAGAGGPTTDGVAENTISIDQDTGQITITDRAIATNSGAYTVTATADSTSPIYTEGSTTTTTITVTVNKVALLPLAYDPATITTDVGTANDTGISPSWSLIDTAGITYSIAAAGVGAGGPTTDGVTENTINFNQATGQITITDRAIATNSGAYTVTATADSTSPAYTDGSTTTTTITVTVNKIDLLPLAYNPATITTDVGTASAISPSWSLADMTGITYSIAAAGAGGPTTDGVTENTISIDQATGQITITDRAIATNSGAYTVTATADSTSPVYTEGSTTTTTITVTVNRVNLNTKTLTYNANTITTHGTANEEGISPSWSLADTAGITYSIVAAETDGPIADGAGTTINIDLGSGKITSTADVSVDNNGAYVVTATADSTSPAYIADTMTTTTIMVVDTYKIGDTGPAGGKIFYVNENYETDDWRYLEAAPTEHEQDARWGANLKMATSTDIGTGRANTELIVAETEGYDRDIGTEYAAKICSEFVLNGYDDWFLPSRDELDALYQHRNKVGGFVEQPHTNTIYWSSSASTQYVILAWGQDDHGQSGRLNKGSSLTVRPVRSF